MNSVKLSYRDKSTGVLSEYVFEAHSPERAAHIIKESLAIDAASNFELVGVATA